MTTNSPRDSRFNYNDCLPPEWRAVRESRVACHQLGAHWSERHLQCVWSDPALRPPVLTTSEGAEEVRVTDAGRWNLEAGPDFLDAVLLVGPGRRRLVGDIEVHIRPADWTGHRHGDDPRYARVVAHVTYFPGALPADALPPHAVQLALRDALLARPGFSFDDIDLSAYPHAVIPPAPRPCAEALGGDPDRRRSLLLAAGRHRLQLKSRRLAARLEQGCEPPQLLYEEVVAALGYKQNTTACRRLARALPLAAWPRQAPPLVHYARLLGVAGLLPPPGTGADDETRRFLRQLWDIWWRHPAPAPDPPLVWRLDALRPANHPARRLAAAAAIFGGQTPLETLWSDLSPRSPRAWTATVGRRLRQRARLADLERLPAIAGQARGGARALLGAARTAAIINNVLAPFLNLADPLPDDFLAALPPESLNAPVRATATRLFGRDHNPALYAGSGLMQQGLLQIFADFCLNARAGCADCRLAQHLRTP